MNIINLHYIKVRVAQRIARWTSNPEVVGSNPTVDAFFSFLYNAKKKWISIVLFLVKDKMIIRISLKSQRHLTKKYMP